MCIEKKLVIAAWEIGHASSPYGVKVGGMGGVVQELPAEMEKYAKTVGLNLEIEVLSPCFRFYDRACLQQEEKVWVPQFNTYFDVYSYVFKECGNYRIKHLYFWNEAALNAFGEREYAQSIYPADPWEAMRVYARVGAAMATHIEHSMCDALHLHDYHMGLVLFYLNAKKHENLSVVFTIHNAGYQGRLDIRDIPGPIMAELSIPKECYYHYFRANKGFNMLKAAVLKAAEIGGKITTVSEGYAEQLRLTEDEIRQRALAEGLSYPQEVFIPSGGIVELAQVGIIGIDNGLSEENKPEYLKFFQAEVLREIQSQQETPIFHHPEVQRQMLSINHNYSTLQEKQPLRELLFLECFSAVPEPTDIVFCAIGRLTAQKNFDILLRCIEPVIHRYRNAYFVIMGSPAQDVYGSSLQRRFVELAKKNANIRYSSEFNEPLSKLILAGSDFCIIPSRFEPCGIIDYEAALLGSVPIVRKTGGLVKTLPRAFSYSWYDESDSWGEVFRLTIVIERAIDEYLQYRSLYRKRVRDCMKMDTNWQKSVKKYFQLYKFAQTTGE